jgi:hypothetical protein
MPRDSQLGTEAINQGFKSGSKKDINIVDKLNE